MGWEIAFYYPGVMNCCRVGKVYQMSVSSGLFSSHAQLHCAWCLIEALLEIVMILSFHQWGFVRVDTAYNLFSG